ncbi:pilin N-terminal domain-containing protein [Alloscardovia venturai]|uniref:Pilin N-terminal domain-containing protein n=1 Tax=Alloscardovia venturai TaxID=1769421 RepID=A0ABW2Y5L5_9BIFI
MNPIHHVDDKRGEMMRAKSKVLAALVALFMMVGTPAAAMGTAVVAHAANDKTSTVTIHKLMMTDTQLDSWTSPEKYDGTQSLSELSTLAGQDLKEVAGVYFAAQNKAGKWINANGQEVSSAKDALGGLTTATGLALNVSNFDQSKPTVYRFVEVKELSEYKGADGQTLSRQKATDIEVTLPFVKADGSILDNVQTYPKNTETGKPEHSKALDTSADKTGSDVKNHGMSVTKGDNVPFVLTTKIAAGSTLNKADWNDTMSAGLKMNKDVTITDNAGVNLAQGDYTVTYTDKGFALALKASGLTKLAKVTAPTDASFKVLGADPAVNGQNKAVTFTLKYSANVTEDAQIEQALDNSSTFHYGNNPGYTTEPGDNNPPTVTPKNHEITVKKSFTNGPTAASPTTDWPAGLKITYTLQVFDPTTVDSETAGAADNGWTNVSGQSLELNATKTTGSFTGLDDSKSYRVVETAVDGWVPNYSVDTDGNVVVVNKKNVNPQPIGPKHVTVVTFGKKWVKTSQEATERLAGAKFVIKNSAGKFLALQEDATNTANKAAYESAMKAYQDEIAKFNKDNTSTTQANIDAKYNAMKAAYEAMNEQYRWVDSQDDALVLTSDEAGRFEINGLRKDTYNLVEIAAPAGYALNSAPISFEVKPGSYTTGNIEYSPTDASKTATQVINKKVTIPQTGGMGTILFTIAGIAIMVAAVVALKMNNKKSESDAE